MLIIQTALQKKPITRVPDVFHACIVSMFRGLKAIQLTGRCDITGITYNAVTLPVSELWESVELEEVFT